MFKRLLLLVCAALLLPLSAEVPRGTDVSRLNKGNPAKSYRQRTFCAYKPVEQVGKEMKISRYSSYENPTGILYKAGEVASITVQNAPAGTLQLMIRDFGEDGARDTYPLTQGTNTITIKRGGLAYIDYRHADGTKAPTINMRLSGGIINGVFTQHDDKATWKRLLGKAQACTLDMVGERCQIAYPVEKLRKCAAEDGVEVLDLYDRIVELQQRLMGWDDEGIHPGNHVLFRVMWSGFMQADGEGASFHNNTIEGICNPESLRKSSWGVAHELGHVNQVKPGFCWAGLTEVSNNVFSAWCNYDLNRNDLRLEHEVTANYDGERMRGGRFDCYINNAIVERQLWQFQGGADSSRGKVPDARPGDHFVSVCPLWQFQLYFHEACGNTKFYPTIFRKVREANDSETPHGAMRVNFCRYVSEAAGQDMSYFLLRTGMLALINRTVNDYRPHMMTITRGMVEDCVREAARLPEPESSVIFYINGNNVDIYRKRLAVERSADFTPNIPEGGGSIIFPAEKWKNTVAFEVYEGRKLVRICLRGLGQQDDASTTVICPPGATAIRAVQWDGKRLTVSQRATAKD